MEQLEILENYCKRFKNLGSLLPEIPENLVL